MTVLINRNVLQVTISTGVELDLAAYLNGLNTAYTKFFVTISEFAVIGSNTVGVPALTTGDLTGLDVTVHNYGEIQGASGNRNSGDGGDAFIATSDVVFTNFGAIRSGGGGGGKGGVGSTGEWISGGNWTTQYVYDTSNVISYWVYKKDDGSYSCYPDNDWEYYGCRWNGGLIGVPCSYGYLTEGNYVFTRGNYKRYDQPYPSDPHTGNVNLYEIKRGYVVTTSGGTSRNAGYGQGYDRNQSNGSNGYDGGSYAGDGGRSGDGGNWGEDGDEGDHGLTGTYFKQTGSSQNDDAYYTYRATRSDYDDGISGGDAGYSVSSSGGITFTFDNQGTINGPTNIV